SSLTMMTTVRRLAAATTFGAILGLGAPLAAQVFPDGREAGAGAYIESYDFLNPATTGVERVSLMSVPIGVRVPIVDRLEVEVAGSFASASMERADGSTISLSGPTDAEVRANYEVVPDLFSVSLGALLPAGNASQTLDELELAGLIAADLLPFRISNWGT